MLVTLKNVPSYTTRDRSDVQLSFVTSVKFCSSICFQAARLSNKLPKLIKGIEDNRAFLKNAKNMLFAMLKPVIL